MNKILLSEPYLGKAEISTVTKTIKDNWISTAGSNISKFENKISNYTKSKYCIACNSGTSALHIALKVLGVNKKHEVIAPSITFIATINAIRYNDASPIFMDVDNSFNIDEDKTINFLEQNTKIVNGQCVNKKTKKVTKVVIIAHIWGGGAKFKKLIAICKKKKIKILEDAAESLGTFYKKYLKNKHTGTIGNIGILSFNGNKIITTGAGGMILTNNKSLEKKCRYLINQAKNNEFFLHNKIGYNYRMASLNASLGIPQINNIKKITKLKEKNFFNYCKVFDKSKIFKVFDYNNISRPNFWMIVLILKDKINKNFIDYLLKKTSKKIEFRKIWLPNERQKMYRNSEKFKISNSKHLYKISICSPSSANLKLKDVRYINRCINEEYSNFLKNNR